MPKSKNRSGQIKCGFITASGKPCQVFRDLDKQCPHESHLRTLDDLEEVARKHCELTDQPLPATFGNVAEQLEIQRQEWLVQFKLLGCRYGQATEAAVKIGITDNAKQFASFARKHFKDEISSWMDEQAMPANEAIALVARNARNEVAEYYTDGTIDPGLEKYLREGISSGRINPDVAEKALTAMAEVGLDAARLVRDGRGDLIKGIKQTKYGPVYETTDPDAALQTIIEIHGLKKINLNLTKLSDDELFKLAAATPEVQLYVESVRKSDDPDNLPGTPTASNQGA